MTRLCDDVERRDAAVVTREDTAEAVSTRLDERDPICARVYH